MRKPTWIRNGIRIMIRGEEWAISRRPGNGHHEYFYPFFAARLVGERADWHGLLSWNGVAWGSHSRPAPAGHAFAYPAWIAVAWMAIRIDPDEGLKFARKILKAAPGDDSPALIAADFIGGKGAYGTYSVTAKINQDGFKALLCAYRGEDPPPAPVRTDDFIFPELVRSLPCEGPLGDWAKAFIRSTCIWCGYLRDGSDRVAVARFDRARLSRGLPIRWTELCLRRNAEDDRSWPRCPSCGHPSDGRAPIPPLPMFDPNNPLSNGGQEP